MGEDNRILKTTISVTGIVLVSKILGFIKQIVIANVFGATIHTDIISLSEGLVSNIDYLLVQALSTAFIPAYYSAIHENRCEGNRFVSNVIKLFFLITIIISLVCFFSAPFIAKVLAPSYSSELLDLLARYIRLFSPVLIVITEMAIINSLLKANECFLPGELVGFNQSIIHIVLVLLLGRKYGIDSLVIAFYFYALFNLGFLLIKAKTKWSYHEGNPFRDNNVKKLLLMMGPLLLGYSMVFVNQQVDKIIVSGLEAGTVTAMGYAAVLSNFISTFIGSICTIMFTYITQKISQNEYHEASVLIKKAVIQLVTIFLPISILTIMNSTDIVTIVFGHGKFDSSAIKNCSNALIGYGCMFVPLIIREMFSRFHYASGDTKKPMINSSICIFINIVGSIILSRLYGVFGVTLATSIAVLVCAILNYASSIKKGYTIGCDNQMKGLNITFLKWGIGGVVCIIVSIAGNNVLKDISSYIRFSIVSFVSLLLYLLINFRTIHSIFKLIIKKEVEE